MKALLIIDMQYGDFPPINMRHDPDGTVSRINQLSAKFRERDYPVIFIQHDGSGESTFIPGSHDWQLLDSLDRLEQDELVRKRANNAFYNSKLNQILKENKIKELYITGSATDFCVEATVQSALNLDYDITVVGDAHTTGDRPHLAATKIIEHYNWVWQDLIPTGGSIRVIHTQEAIKQI